MRGALEAIFAAALDAVDPAAAVRRAVVREDGVGREAAPGGGRGRLVLAGEPLAPGARLGAVAVGKAALPMAAAFEAVAGGDLAWGLGVTKEGHGREPTHGLRRFALREAAHPVPDARCEVAAREVLERVAREPAPDALVVLLSGGTSSLWACPLPGLALEDVAAATRTLLAAGAPIEELNAVRKHLCELAGGRLAAASAAPRVHVLVISDVLGDRLEVIASGPCAPDPTTYADALEILERRAPARAGEPPSLARVRAHLEAGTRGERPESPGPDHPAFAGGRVRHAVLASNATALDAAADAARRAGYAPRVVTRALRGEARVAGRRLAGLGRAAAAALAKGAPATSPTPEAVCLLAGGETTVTVRGEGRGGRSQELALAAALTLAGFSESGLGSRSGSDAGADAPGDPPAGRVGLLAAGTDGSDGPTDAAGAFADAGSVARGRRRGVDAGQALARNDAYAFFAAEGGLLRTGPTGTNVMDLVLVGVGPPTRPDGRPKGSRAPSRPPQPSPHLPERVRWARTPSPRGDGRRPTREAPCRSPATSSATPCPAGPAASPS